MNTAIKHQLDAEPKVMLACETLTQWVNYWTSDVSGKYVDRIWTKDRLLDVLWCTALDLSYGIDFGHSIIDSQVSNMIEYFGIECLVEAITILKGNN